MASSNPFDDDFVPDPKLTPAAPAMARGPAGARQQVLPRSMVGPAPVQEALRNPEDKSKFRLRFGLGQYADAPVPQMLRPVVEGMSKVSTGVDYLGRGMAKTLAAPIDLSRSAGYWAGGIPDDRTSTLGEQLAQAAGFTPTPPDQGLPGEAAEALGGGMGMSLLLRKLGLVPKMFGPVGTAIQEGVTAGTSTLGQHYGADIAEKLFGERARTAGGIVGSFLGGGGPAVAANYIGKPILRSQLGKSGPLDDAGRTPSRAVYDDLMEAGITPLPNAVGGLGASRLMNTIAALPVVGSRAQGRIENALRQFQGSLYQTAGRIAGRPYAVEEALTPDVLGARLRESARRGEANLDRELQGNYDRFYKSVPEETLVTPRNVETEIQRQRNPATGESAATRTSVDEWKTQNIDNATIGGQGPVRPGATLEEVIPGLKYNAPGPQGGVSSLPPQGPAAPGAPRRQGVPIQQAANARKEAFRDAEGAVGAEAGALKQTKEALDKDINSALMNDPAMVRAFPDPRARLEKIEQLDVLRREYAMAHATDVSRAGGLPHPERITHGDRFYVGGDYPSLDKMKNTPADPTIFNKVDPGDMSVLQRTDTPNYPQNAADVILGKSQAKAPSGDINIDPAVLAKWWNNLGENERAILANSGFRPGRSFPLQGAVDPPPTPALVEMNRLGRVGQAFKEGGVKPRTSDTSAPTLSTMAAITGAVIDPIQTAKALALGSLAGSGLSSPKLAQIIAGAGPTPTRDILRALYQHSGQTAALADQPHRHR